MDYPPHDDDYYPDADPARFCLPQGRMEGRLVRHGHQVDPADVVEISVEEHSDTPIESPRLFPCSWVPFDVWMPTPAYDPKRPGRPTHGAILVTNNRSSRYRWGAHSHVWLVHKVHEHPDGPYYFMGECRAEQDEITAFSATGDQPIRYLTHWRPAVPEEWEYDSAGLPVRCVVSDPSQPNSSLSELTP